MHAVTVTHNEGRRKREKERGEGFAFLHRLARSKGEKVDIEEENGRIIFRIYAHAGAVIRAVKLVSSSVRHRTGFYSELLLPSPVVWTRATIPLHSPPARPKIRGLLRRIAWIEIRLAAVRSDRTFKFPPLGYSNE